MPTRMTLQLVDHSISRPYGVIEDVLVRVKHFKDQKIDFDLFVEDKLAPEHNVCLQVMEGGQDVLKVGTKT